MIELKSLVENYTNPLLHPLLSTSPRMSSPPTPSGQFTRQSLPAATASSADLPIAARFLRSSPSSLSSSSLDHLPEIRLEGDDACCRAALDKETRRSSSASSQPLPSPSPRNASSTGLGGVTGRLAAFAFGRSRQERSSSAPSSSRSSERDPVGRPVTAPPLPDALRRVLEATLDMLKGHEALSAKLKEQWTKSFPLVRGLGATWSDQVRFSSCLFWEEGPHHSRGLTPKVIAHSPGSCRRTPRTSSRSKKHCTSSTVTSLQVTRPPWHRAVPLICALGRRKRESRNNSTNN